MKRYASVLILAAFAAAGAGKAPKKPPPGPPPPLTAPSAKLADAMGGKVDEQLRGASRFEIARTSYAQGIRPKPQWAIGSDFQREADWQQLEAEQISKLRALVYEEKSFRLGADVTGCDFKPDVAFQMSNSGIDSLQMLVSFKCNQVLFFSVKNGGRTVPGVALDFKPSRKMMLALVKSVLREDATVQALR